MGLPPSRENPVIVNNNSDKEFYQLFGPRDFRGLLRYLYKKYLFNPVSYYILLTEFTKYDILFLAKK